jgi:hypothetical protein
LHAFVEIGLNTSSRVGVGFSGDVEALIVRGGGRRSNFRVAICGLVMAPVARIICLDPHACSGGYLLILIRSDMPPYHSHCSLTWIISCSQLFAVFRFCPRPPPPVARPISDAAQADKAIDFGYNYIQCSDYFVHAVKPTAGGEQDCRLISS